MFKLSPSGKLTVLHTFTGPPDGLVPVAGLIRDKTGNLCGTTPAGRHWSVQSSFPRLRDGF